MKMIRSLLFAGVFCMLLTGCASSKSASAPEETTLPETTAALPETENDEIPEPVLAQQIKDGTYPIEVTSSSSMFRVTDAVLTVAGDEMTAVLTLGGTGYEKLYVGTGEEALADSDDNCSYFVVGEDGQYTYEVPVAALDLDIDVAAWSIRKETWYDRILVFGSSLIPEDVITR